MARPGIVRADTIDLQDPEAPSAQDHSHSPRLHQGPHVAAHQAAEVRHVMQERQSEEQSLHEAWAHAANDVHLGPVNAVGNDDNNNHHAGHVEEITDDQLHDQHDGPHEAGEHAESESDAISDDDMLDRISSSPSIDDGAYPHSLPTTNWPERSSSLTPTRGTFNRSATSTPDSSPFVQSPAHFPLRMHQGSLSDASPSAFPPSSPFDQTPAHLPSCAPDCETSPLASKDHHLIGEYAYRNDEGFYEYDTDTAEYDSDGGDEQTLSMASDDDDDDDDDHDDMQLNQIDGHTGDSTSEVEIQELLLPDNDLLLESGFEDRPRSPARSSSSWSTISDASITANDNLEDPATRDDDTEDFSFYDNERFVDSGWGGECLRDTEDIDFDFVYALHTFVATVEGQANAQKGDTMVLLDDSNSYWWLVRIVKDSSIGYLPAEHIETPTERLARLNKHRNVDLSATMLGDSPEKTKNPLKKAMRRRNAKTVQFAAPTYVEASDYDYSSDEEDNAAAAEAFLNGGAAAVEHGAEHASAEHTENVSADADVAATNGMHDSAPARDSASPTIDAKSPGQEPHGSPTLVDKSEAAPLKSRKGNSRNTDSFLKDDGATTRKITLTPNLLREDGSSSNTGSFDNVRSNSMESLEKVASPPPEKPKEDKKKKEKKQGMLSGLFKSKKKDKKSKIDDESDVEKVSGETSRMSTAQSSGRASPIDRPLQSALPEQKSRGKLQKTNPIATSEMARTPASEPALVSESRAPTQFIAELEGSQVAYEAPTGVEDSIREVQSRQGISTTPERSMSPEQVQSKLASITNRMRTSDSQDKPKKAKKAKTRVELDDFDDLDEDDEEQQPNERLSESPVEVPQAGAFMDGTDAVHIPMAVEDGPTTPPEELQPDAHGPSEESSTLTSSPSMVDVPTDSPQNEAETDDDATPVPSKPQSPLLHNMRALSQPTPPPARQAPVPPQRDLIPERAASLSSSVSSRASPSPISPVSPSWSDANLRAWLDGSQNDVKDMLVVINDKSDVVPVGPDHPLMAGLFVEESKKLQGFREELDGFLGGLLSRRRGRNTPTPTPKSKTLKA
ncbi:hypothetical protein MBLNU459_g3373t1 [Dothideomycetes sp. NU459]